MQEYKNPLSQIKTKISEKMLRVQKDLSSLNCPQTGMLKNKLLGVLKNIQ